MHRVEGRPCKSTLTYAWSSHSQVHSTTASAGPGAARLRTTPACRYRDSFTAQLRSDSGPLPPKRPPHWSLYFFLCATQTTPTCLAHSRLSKIQVSHSCDRLRISCDTEHPTSRELVRAATNQSVAILICPWGSWRGSCGP